MLMTYEAEIGQFSVTNPSFTLLGTIHTHQGFTARPSSVHLHQQFDIQLEQPSAIGIIVAPERNEIPSYTITPYGMSHPETVQWVKQLMVVFAPIGVPGGCLLL